MGDFQLSRHLAKLLRHDAVSEGLELSPEGYADVEDVLKVSRISRSKYTVADVEKVYQHDKKGRFQMRTIGGRKQIKAAQGHSIELHDNTDLTPITHFTEARSVLHGTKSSLWSSIKSQGLKRKTRTHIHFAPGEQAQSGFPPGCDIAIQINLKKALEGGLKFYRSSNGVILCPGNESGVVSPRYFERAYNIDTKEDLH